MDDRPPLELLGKLKCHRADSIDALSDVVGTFIIPALAILGIMFNLASIVFLGHREVRLRRSLTHQFIFLNTFDRYNCNDKDCCFTYWKCPVVYCRATYQVVP